MKTLDKSPPAPERTQHAGVSSASTTIEGLNASSTKAVVSTRPPIFVDATGRRSRVLRGLGLLVAAER